MVEDSKMAKVYIRVDDRLIHGQTVVAWCPALEIKRIVAIDDESAKNPTLKTIMTMGVPKVYKTSIVTREEAKQILSKEINDNTLVICKYPKILTHISEIIARSEKIILGNLAKRADTNHNLKGATGIFYLSDEDIEIIDKIVANKNVVEFQQLPNTTKTTWEKFKKDL